MSATNHNESLQQLMQRMTLLSDRLGYRALFEYKKLFTADKADYQPITMAVHRSLPFDWVDRVLGTYTALWQADIQPCFYSSYDPALLSLSTVADDEKVQSADLHLVWIDWRLLCEKQSAEATAERITTQLKQLREHTNAPIVINNWPAGNTNPALSGMLATHCNAQRQWFEELNYYLNHELPNVIANTCVIDLQQLAFSIGESFWDARNDQVSHYPFSDTATIEIAKHLGCQLLPALFGQKQKALVLDLDETLYRGILGEDGIDGVLLTEGHLALQQSLKQLKQHGFLLTLCSRNDADEVKKLFEKRSDFVLQWDDFTTTCINWQSKSENINTIAAALNIHSSSMIFVDDNPAELLQVGGQLPVSLILADKDAFVTLKRLVFTPGLFTVHRDTVAEHRQQDIQAQAKRHELLQQTKGDTSHYLASLNMIVTLEENNPEHTNRLCDLSQRTNQFNLTFKRYNAAEANTVLTSESYCTLMVGLSDSLSDSGIIGAFVSRIENNTATLEECIMSCRALGREVETIALVELLTSLEQRHIETLQIEFTQAERNQPALLGLQKIITHCNESLQENRVTISIKSALAILKPIVAALPVSIQVSNPLSRQLTSESNKLSL